MKMNICIYTNVDKSFYENGAVSQALYLYQLLNCIKDINCIMFSNKETFFYKNIKTHCDFNILHKLCHINNKVNKYHKNTLKL